MERGKPGGPLDRAKGQTDSLAALSLTIPAPLPLIQLQSLDDRILNLLRGRPRGEVFADPFSRHTKLFLLVGLFLLHDGEYDFFTELSFLGKAPHFDGLCMGWCAILKLYHLMEHVLFFFGKIRQLHSGTHGNLTFIHHVQQGRDQVSQADIAKNLIPAFATLFTNLSG